jgi:hypothetical protein
MKTTTKTSEPKIVLAQDDKLIDLLKTKTSAIAESMTRVLTLYNDFEIKLPTLLSVTSILSLKDVKAIVTEQVENEIPESQLKVGSMKIKRDKMVDLIGLPDYSELNKAIISLQESLNDSRFRNPALYEIKDTKVQVVDSVLQIEIERCKVYAERPEQIEMFKALEQIGSLLNSVVFPQAEKMTNKGYIYKTSNSLPSHPRYTVNYEKIFEHAFTVDRHKKTIEINRKFIIDL